MVPNNQHLTLPPGLKISYEEVKAENMIDNQRINAYMKADITGMPGALPDYGWSKHANLKIDPVGSNFQY